MTNCLERIKMPRGVYLRLKGKKLSWEHRKNLSLSHIGKIGYWGGKKRPEISEKLKKRVGELSHRFGKENKWGKHTEETRKNMSIARSGKKNAFYGKHHSERTKQILREKISINKKLGKYCLKPNKPERVIIKVIKDNNLPLDYVGDGKFFIDGFNPDFVNKEKGLIVEVFGSYWHSLSRSIKKDKEKLEIYSKYGYKTLIILEEDIQHLKTGRPLDDLSKVINKLNKFTKC